MTLKLQSSHLLFLFSKKNLIQKERHPSFYLLQTRPDPKEFETRKNYPKSALATVKQSKVISYSKQDGPLAVSFPPPCLLNYHPPPLPLTLSPFYLLISSDEQLR